MRDRLRQPDKYGVSLHRVRDLDLRQRANRRFQALGHGVRVFGVPQPGAVLQHPDPRRRQEAHLRGKLPALFAAVIKLARQFGVEKHDRLAQRDAVL